MLMIFKLSENQPIDTMKADYCVGVNLSEQTLIIGHFDLTRRRCPTVKFALLDNTIGSFVVAICQPS